MCSEFGLPQFHAEEVATVSDKYKVDIPEGRSGDWRVERFTVSPEHASMERVRALSNGGRFVPEGTYTGLYRGQVVVMSDTPDEIRDHREAIFQAKGKCLVNGLGLGVVARAMLETPEVEHVTVVEKSVDVIDLVGAHLLLEYQIERLEIIHKDCFDFQPEKGERWNVVWHDIWDYLCEDNLPEMHRLHRKYGRRCDWQGSWGRDYIERRRRA